ncbi:hypothetical protein BLL52_2493 [Rhodoferax antarcticus ANT.BR]|uniref:Uncharacterized protein n=1 Tax=Rhodoferax antarcticus ANT.BR TaxID=1111071 RepID=A0A1Q8YE66_9BURK|nr:hypothetical protein BLL52_2493 [Rhodoferax antarcticus ANT.BR]
MEQTAITFPNVFETFSGLDGSGTQKGSSTYRCGGSAG